MEMTDRPNLNKNVDSETFKNYYYLKEELVSFCKKEGLQTSGGKLELTDRIVHYLETGEKKTNKQDLKHTVDKSELFQTSIIEQDFICSEKHRAFFKKEIGKSFSFYVPFQKWLKENAGKTYKDAIEAYHQILEDKKKGITKIDRQFEYNTYIRDFFANNPGKSLADAILCWNYKKGQKGHNCYEESDLKTI